MALFGELLVIDDAASRDGPLNMAIDEALLESATAPLLRFYRWEKPWISLGYFSRWEEAQTFAHDRPMVRRWTGGGIVPHGDDLTYSLIIPRATMEWTLGSREIYRAAHGAIAVALGRAGIRANLISKSGTKVSDACFANLAEADVMENGRKIAGAAQRKTRAGLLHQGSIQRRGLDGTFRQEFAQTITKKLGTTEIAAATLRRAAELARAKYASHGWLQRR